MNAAHGHQPLWPPDHHQYHGGAENQHPVVGNLPGQFRQDGHGDGGKYNATYGYAEPVEPPSPDVVALRAFVEATPRRCASAPSAPSCRTDNLPDMPLGAWFRAAH